MNDPVKNGIKAGLNKAFGPNGPFDKALQAALAPVGDEITRLRKIERRYQWKPIKDAPAWAKDGRPILVSRNGDQFWACWVEDDTGSYWDRDIEYGGEPIEPDHWFHVPRPPVVVLPDRSPLATALGDSGLNKGPGQ